jgi:hypothetical protein
MISSPANSPICSPNIVILIKYDSESTNPNAYDPNGVHNEGSFYFYLCIGVMLFAFSGALY